jgi:quercetin dioxygenase-like cupin family protein
VSHGIAAFVIALSLWTQQAAREPVGIRMEALLQTATAWDGSSYRSYPEGPPQLSVLRITIPAHTTMDWHRHPIPNAAYVVSGEITVEKRDGGATRRFVKGEVIAETVNALHRGVTGNQAVELLVFYAGAAGQPLSERAPQ